MKPLTPRFSRNLRGKARGQLFTVSTAKPSKHQSRLDRLKTKEQWLRDEIRANRTTLLTLMRWGVAVLAAVASSVYLIRRDVANHLSAIGSLPPYGTVPPGRWFVGTAFLIMIAAIFCFMTSYVIKRHIKHRDQLLKMRPSYSGIEEDSGNGKIRFLHIYLFFAFPFFDLIVWCYFRFGGSITIQW